MYLFQGKTIISVSLIAERKSWNWFTWRYAVKFLKDDISLDAKVSMCEKMSCVYRFYGSITALLASWHKTFILFFATYSLFLNFSTTKKKKKGSRASTFIAENGIKARWKRASVVFRGLDGRIRRMDVGRLVRIYPSIHPQRNSEWYGGYIF